MFSFFFPAEDGIRDAQEFCWLGDVYKRQPELRKVKVAVSLDCATAYYGRQAVSYTHLTLATNLRVEISVVAVFLKKKNKLTASSEAHSLEKIGRRKV